MRSDLRSHVLDDFGTNANQLHQAVAISLTITQR